LTDLVDVRRGTYFDSVTLMLVSRDASSTPGVETAAVMAATPLNRDVLSRQGFTLPDDVGPNDLVVAIRAEGYESAHSAARVIEARLGAGEHVASPAGVHVHGAGSPRTVCGALRRNPDTNLLLVTVPGLYASLEVAAGLEAGLHVFCFSSGMDVDEEVALKELAVDKGVLLMGPDCGTAILDGVGLGFANVVSRGPVGIVAAGGTAIQELTCLLDSAGVGISHAIGVGGRDLSVQVGGLMTIQALRMLLRDPSTETIVVLSKPPDPEVAFRVVETAAGGSKPVVVAFLGPDRSEPSLHDAMQARFDARLHSVASLEDAAVCIAGLHGRSLPNEVPEVSRRTPGFIRGLFCGGSLCYEAMTHVSAALGPVWSNIPLRPQWRIRDFWQSHDHTFIDFGDEEMVEGRVHPMIDPSLRNERVLQDSLDPSVGAVVFDVVLGRGAHDDPVGQLAPLLRHAREARGESLTIVASVCGTQDDPQDLGRQRRLLAESGAVVTNSAANAARVAIAATQG
jgi:FdrA protein